MTEPDDHELLAAYTREASEPAFAALVARYVHLVHSAALRRTGNPHHAQEITQAVFLILARKAGRLRRGVVLSGWLYQTARLTAANFVRREIHRQQREQEACLLSMVNEPAAAAWEQVAPWLDEAMGRLGETDRNALVLRYFENKTAREIGTRLKMNEAATHKRVSRALDKLRKFLVKRGVALSATTLAGAVSAHSVQAAPAGLAATISATAVPGSAVAASTLTLVKGALKLMTWTKAKAVVITGVALILAGGTTTVLVKHLGHPVPGRPPMTAAAEAAFQQESQQRFNVSKQWALCCIMFAVDHQNQLPKNFAQMKTYAGNLSADGWEIVSGGDINRIAKPSQTILLREKAARQNPDGAFVRTYAFADGHCEQINSAGGDFAFEEKQHGLLVHPAGN
jgi:RNA polymerase sigma factor (sigma-70 family)